MISFEETGQIDDQIHQLALYTATEGKIIMPKDQESLMEIHRKMAHFFNYYKKLIQDNESSLEDIREDVLSTYGPFPATKRLDIEDPFFFTKLTEIEEKQMIDKGTMIVAQKQSNEAQSMIQNILKNFAFPVPEQKGKIEIKDILPLQLPSALSKTKTKKRKKNK